MLRASDELILRGGAEALTPDSIITLIGTLVTIGGASVSIWQASQARSYKRQISFDLRKISLNGAVEKMKRAQDEIRKLMNDKQPRGIRRQDIDDKIREHFDFALGAIHCDGLDKDIRETLKSAQSDFNYYTAPASGTPDQQHAIELQQKVQDVISKANQRIFELDGRVQP